MTMSNWGRRQSVLAVLFFMLALKPALAVAEVLEVGHIRPDVGEDQRSDYFLELLDAALAASSETFGPYRLVEAPVQMTQSRAMHEMGRDEYVHVIWTMTSTDREAELRPVRIPLLRGLLGVRAAVVPAGQAARLEGVDTLETLSELIPGQGHDWPDTAILRANGIRVETASSYEGLFRMLVRGRIDYIPRSVAEVWGERSMYQRHDLVIADHFLLAYTAPIYFFVAADNSALAERLEYGLNRLIESGEFRHRFETHPANREAIERFFANPRPIIWLNNPDLPEETPLDVAELWFEPVFRHHEVGD